MSDKEENLPGRRGAKAAHHSKRKKKKNPLSANTRFNGANPERVERAGPHDLEPAQSEPGTIAAMPPAGPAAESPGERRESVPGPENDRPPFEGTEGAAAGDSPSRHWTEAVSENMEAKPSREEELGATRPEPEQRAAEATAAMPPAGPAAESPGERRESVPDPENARPAFEGTEGAAAGDSPSRHWTEAVSENMEAKPFREDELGATRPEPEQRAAEATAAMPPAGPAAESPGERKDSFSETPKVKKTRPPIKPPTRTAPPTRDGYGRGKSFVWLALLALVLSLVAAGSAYYTYSLVDKERQARMALSEELAEQLDTQIDSRVTSQLDEQLTGRLDEQLTGRLDEQFTGREKILKKAVTGLKGKIDEHGDELKAVQKEVAALEASLRILREETEKGPKPGSWDVAEAAYLMRIANERLHLEQDVKTALVALQTADQVLQKVADPALTPVRSKLAEEINSLKAVPVPDIDGMALSLTSLIDRVKELELKDTVLEESVPASEPEQQEPDPSLEAEDNVYIAKAREFLHVIWSDLKRLVVVRHRGEGEGGIGIPILPPEERYYLYQNLRLQLEAARLSLLRQNEDGFRQTLQQAQSWLQTYFEGPEAEVMEDTLVKLEQVSISPSLPSIAGSLKALNQVWEHMRSQAAGDGKGGET